MSKSGVVLKSKTEMQDMSSSTVHYVSLEDDDSGIAAMGRPLNKKERDEVKREEKEARIESLKELSGSKKKTTSCGCFAFFSFGSKSNKKQSDNVNSFQHSNVFDSPLNTKRAKTTVFDDSDTSSEESSATDAYTSKKGCCF
ncbi:hypothetical protein AYO45_05755 [Gammaproteobacteria bacterium SCGC AG-212-F23]|nr:hypothetical protein AYO45_05755 [Gammaproteobacteria bacterium SCGC AG-212-F23]